LEIISYCNKPISGIIPGDGYPNILRILQRPDASQFESDEIWIDGYSES
jgi:hypothetical protein